MAEVERRYVASAERRQNRAARPGRVCRRAAIAALDLDLMVTAQEVVDPRIWFGMAERRLPAEIKAILTPTRITIS